MTMAPLRTSLGSVRTHTRQVFDEVADRWPIYFAWGIGASGEHKQGRAIDFMTYADGTVKAPGPIRVDVGKEIAAYLWANHTRLGIWYVIHRQQIISVNSNGYGPAGRWNHMPDRGDPTANHMDHVHVSLLDSPPAYKPPASAPVPNPTPASERYIMYPGEAWLNSMPNSPIITAMGKRLVAVGCGKYQQGPGPQCSDVDVESYKAWQAKLGVAVGWPPGKESWDRLQVPNPAYKEDEVTPEDIEKVADRVVDKLLSKQVVPGAATRDIGGYPDDWKGAALLAFLYAPDAKLNEVRRTLKQIIAAQEAIADGMGEQVKTAVREAIAGQVDVKLVLDQEKDGETA